MESIRDKCVYEAVKSAGDPTFHRYFNHLVILRDNLLKIGAITKSNIDKILRHSFKVLELDLTEINECVENSFDEVGNYESDNKFLREDRKWQELQNVRIHPAITINNQTYFGDLAGYDIAKAVCSAFQKRPD